MFLPPAYSTSPIAVNPVAPSRNAAGPPRQAFGGSTSIKRPQNWERSQSLAARGIRGLPDKSSKGCPRGSLFDAPLQFRVWPVVHLRGLEAVVCPFVRRAIQMAVVHVSLGVASRPVPSRNIADGANHHGDPETGVSIGAIRDEGVVVAGEQFDSASLPAGLPRS